MTASVTLKLMSRDPTWIMTLFLSIGSAFLLPYAPPSSGAWWLLLMVLPVVLTGAALTMPVADEFESALPIAQTQILFARLLGLLAMTWLPLFTGVPSMLYSGRPVAAALPALEFAVCFTASMLLGFQARIHPRRRAQRILWILSAVAFVLSARSMPLLFAGGMAVVAAGGMLAGANLDDTRTSGSAPNEEYQGWFQVDGFLLPFLSWWPTARYLITWRLVCSILFSVWIGSDRSWPFVALLGIFVLAWDRNLRWLLALPISRRTLLWSRLLPVLAGLWGGMWYGHGNQPRVQILQMAFGAALLLTLALVETAQNWYVLRRAPRALRWACSPLVVLCVGGFFWVNGGEQNWLPRLSAILPDNPLPMAAALLAVLASLCCALEKTFDRVEFSKERV